jgi:hypothetical protein
MGQKVKINSVTGNVMYAVNDGEAQAVSGCPLEINLQSETDVVSIFVEDGAVASVATEFTSELTGGGSFMASTSSGTVATTRWEVKVPNGVCGIRG